MSKQNSKSCEVMSGLKDFQLRTVNYVFDRLYGKNHTNRFLIADEVGLGKTLVAKGIIARVLETLQKEGKRIDIVYICSNAAIASQNISRLSIEGETGFHSASRLTLLPTFSAELRQHEPNFISFTPNTSFRVKRSGGLRLERKVIYKMLEKTKWNIGMGLKNMLQATVKDKEEWRNYLENGLEIDNKIAIKFRKKVRSIRKLTTSLDECCNNFRMYRNVWPEEYSNNRYKLIGELRNILAEICIDELNPDLVILDEFQRFKDILDGNDEAANLARRLLDFNNVRTLLLSATPYKMLSLEIEQDVDHYPDFMRTMNFLYDGNKLKVDGLSQEVQKYREQLIKANPDNLRPLREARDNLQNSLLTVMCRTERVGLSMELDAMLENKTIEAPLQENDIKHAAKVDKVAQILESRDLVEYWKSSPYLLNFLKNYDLRKKLDDNSKKPSDELYTSILRAKDQILKKEHFEHFQKVDPTNARMRILFEEIKNNNMWKLLWLPPSLPYVIPSGEFESTNDLNLTKLLVFSKWNAVPNAIAALCSYESERRMIGNKKRTLTHSNLSERTSQLLKLSTGSDKQLSGMTIALMIPSSILATKIDPLKISIQEGNGKPISKEIMLKIAESKCKELLELLPNSNNKKRIDKRWYWVAPAMLEYKKQTSVYKWLFDTVEGWEGLYKEHSQSSGVDDHFYLLSDLVEGEIELGPQPPDLAKILAELSLAGPGTCALRALNRIAPKTNIDDSNILSAAVRIADGFRSLFNLPQTTAFLQRDNKNSYWRKVLRYAIGGNLQSVLDEHIHVLVDQLGLSSINESDRVSKISEKLAETLSIKPAQISIDEIKPVKITSNAKNRQRSEKKIKISPFNSRSRFALRFSEFKSEQEDELARVEKVQDAFNSPFRPFILASTSIGQEGLDFHTWCHALIHWNLPTNPVDLEQREGRIHRYKGHAVRKNIAEHFGLSGLKYWGEKCRCKNECKCKSDPWEFLFNEAKSQRPKDSSDLVPYWIYEEGEARIERRIPMLPLSREIGQFETLKKNLTFYRMVFGQPRQEDLLNHISRVFEDLDTSDYTISLQPPDKDGRK